MTTAPQGTRKRLGELLVQRRIELNPRWRKRTVFAEDHGLNWRLLYDIERARRDSFSDETLAAIEVAYRWRKGSIAAVIAGGDPVPLDDDTSRDGELDRFERELGVDLSSLDPATRRIWLSYGYALVRRFERDRQEQERHDSERRGA
jgi:hypothetical protein